MDDAGLVRGFQRLGNLARDWQGFVERHRPLRDAVGQRRALDQLEDQGREPTPIPAGRRWRRCGGG